MNSNNQDQSSPVILSAAKNLQLDAEILRCAQNDIPDFGWYYLSGFSHTLQYLLRVDAANLRSFGDARDCQHVSGQAQIA